MGCNFSGNIQHSMAVTTLTDYLVQQGHEQDEEGEFKEEGLYELPSSEIAANIIALQVGVFLMRRTNYLCGSTVDHTFNMIALEKIRFKELTGEDFINYNQGVDW